jgi:hypothetical protein
MNDEELNARFDRIEAAIAALGQQTQASIGALAQQSQSTATFHATLGPALAEIPRRLTQIETILHDATTPGPQT